MSTERAMASPLPSPATPSTPSMNHLGRASTSKGAAHQQKNIVLPQAGRAPWYRADGSVLPAYVVGVAGGSASGKTSVAQAILKACDVPWVAIVSQDSFYKELTPAQSKLAFESKFDFDHPSAFDYDVLRDCIANLKACNSVEIPVYSFVHHQRMQEKTYMYGAGVVIVEGIFVLHDPQTRDLLDLKIFVQADSDLMLARRIRRDTRERGRDVDSVLNQYLAFVKPSYDNFVVQTSKFADVIVPGQDNDVAIDLVASHVRRQLAARSMSFRTELSQTPSAGFREQTDPFSHLPYPHGLAPPAAGGSSSLPMPSNGLTTPGLLSATASPRKVAFGTGLEMARANEEQEVPSNVIALPQTNQIRGLLTILHDKTTPNDEFILTCKRIAGVVVEAGIALLPYRDKTIALMTNGQPHVGTEIDVEDFCAVSILRSGTVLEPAIRRCLPACSLGSLLIQSDSKTGEPHLFLVSLPPSLRSRATSKNSWVFLLDAQIGTGAAALMGIRVLLDHGVAQERILFLSLLASKKGGVWAIKRAFPGVRVIVAGMDDGLQEMIVNVGVEGERSSDEHQHANGVEETKKVWAIVPGMGSIGDRFWGS